MVLPRAEVLGPSEGTKDDPSPLAEITRQPEVVNQWEFLRAVQYVMHTRSPREMLGLSHCAILTAG